MTTFFIFKRVQFFLFCIIGGLMLIGAAAQDAADEQETETQTINSVLSEEQQMALRQLFVAFGGNTAAARQALEDAIVLQAAQLLHVDKSLPSFGGGSGPIVVEFSDYQCGFCKRMLPILRDAEVQVKVVEFPVLGELSSQAARYAIAAQKQGLYEPFHIMMMEREERLSEESLLQVAQSVGLDVDKLKADAESTEVQEMLQRNYEYADMLQVRGTPFFLVNGRPLRGAVDAETFNEMITGTAQ